MSSEKRIAANRKNARRSTGPKTPEGKARSSRNARKHGLLSKDITLPEENPGDFRQLLQAYCDDLQPVGETEEFLVHEIATCQWRLERARRSDTGLWWSQMSEVRRYSSTQYDANNHNDTIYLEGLAFNRASHTFTQQARYEGAIRRAYYRALDDLRRRQDRRAEQSPPAPARAGNLPESNRMEENYETNPPLPQPVAAVENEPLPSALGHHNMRRLGLLSTAVMMIACLASAQLAQTLHLRFLDRWVETQRGRRRSPHGVDALEVIPHALLDGIGQLFDAGRIPRSAPRAPHRGRWCAATVFRRAPPPAPAKDAHRSTRDRGETCSLSGKVSNSDDGPVWLKLVGMYSDFVAHSETDKTAC
jgi:hypothetical protein